MVARWWALVRCEESGLPTADALREVAVPRSQVPVYDPFPRFSRGDEATAS